MILNSSDNPDEQAAQGQDQIQHGLQHRGLGLIPARKLNTTKSLTNLSRTSEHTRRTGLSLASMASGISYSSIVKNLSANIQEGLLRTIFVTQPPEDERIKRVFIIKLYVVQAIDSVTAAAKGEIRNRRLLEDLIAKQAALEIQIEADRLMARQVERDDKREDDRQEVIRLKLVQEMVDREISERARNENQKTSKQQASLSPSYLI